jgi:Flp pilus assembly pilin Flp
LDIMTAPLWCRRLLVDDRGQDLIEYALLAAIIGIAGALVLPQIGPKMGNAFSSWGGQVYNAWTPSDPVP